MTQTIRIRKAGGSVGPVVIETADGQPIGGVMDVDISLRPMEFVTAHLRIMVGAVDVEAHPLLDLETITDAAAAHGYRLVAKGDEE